MQEWGIVKDKKLKRVKAGYPNAKPVRRAEIPKYDQETQAVFEKEPVEFEDYISVDVEIRDVPQDEMTEHEML